MRVRVIANPVAGRGEGTAIADAVVAVLRQHGWQAEAAVTEGPGHARAIVREARAAELDAVVAVGGDGLVNEIINGPLDPEVALGVIPAGTGNVLARELGLPLRWRAAADSLLRSVAVRFDVGVANGRRFLLMLGVGWDAHLLEEVGRAPRPWLGIWQYVPAILRTAWQPHVYQFSVTADGEQHDSPGWMLIAGNTNLYTWLFRPTPEASPADGVLDFALLRGKGRLALTRALLRSVARKTVCEREAVYFRAASAIVRTEPVASFQVDGDLAGEATVEISVEPRALRLLAPPEHLLARSAGDATEAGAR